MIYEIIDRKTMKVVANRLNLKAARKHVDKLDLAYGACRYHYVKRII